MKKILVLLILGYGCSKNDNTQPQPTAFISFYNGTDSVKYSGNFSGNETGVGYYYQYLSDTLYQYEVFGGAGAHDYISMEFFTNDTTTLKGSTSPNRVIGISYGKGDSVYSAQIISSSLHIDGNNHNVLSGSFNGVLKSISGYDSITIKNGRLVNLPFSP